MPGRIPLFKIPLPVYKPSRVSWTHKIPRNQFLLNPKVKYPIYERLPFFWRMEYEEKMPIVHQVLEEGKCRPQHRGLWKKGINGQPERVHNERIRIYYPPASNEGIWGGEGYIKGDRYARGGNKMSRRYAKVWKPIVFKRKFYSEILDRNIITAVTPLTLDLIDEAFGFDYFILKTSSKRLQRFGAGLKREMLLKLARKDTDLYPNDPKKREQIYKKYEEYKIPEEQAEWVGLTLLEAMQKQWDTEKEQGLHDPVPLLEIYTKELKESLGIGLGEHPKEESFDKQADVFVFSMEEKDKVKPT